MKYIRHIPAAIATYYRNLYFNRRLPGLVVLTIAFQIIMPFVCYVQTLDVTPNYIRWSIVIISLFGWWLFIPAVIWLIDFSRGRAYEQQQPRK